MRYWNNGTPYVGANAGIDPGQTRYYSNGTPSLNFYEAVTMSNWKKVLTVTTASTKKVATVTTINIQSIINV